MVPAVSLIWMAFLCIIFSLCLAKCFVIDFFHLLRVYNKCTYDIFQYLLLGLFLHLGVPKKTILSGSW